MLSFTNTPLSFFYYLLFLLSIAGLAASAPTPTTYHRHHLDSPFPYGKLADKLLHINDVSSSYMIGDDDDEDRLIHSYPENHSSSLSSFSSDLLPPIVSLELPAVVLPNLLLLPMIDDDTTPNVGIITTKNKNKNTPLFSFAYRIPDIIRKVVTVHEYWDTALVWFMRNTKEQ